MGWHHGLFPLGLGWLSQRGRVRYVRVVKRAIDNTSALLGLPDVVETRCRKRAQDRG